jgi:DNA-binding CsgD family transcriptional regulator
MGRRAYLWRLVEAPLVRGRAALEAGRWADARAAFEEALGRDPTAEVLDGLAEALWWLGETRRSLEARTRAYAQFRADGETIAAFAAAMSVATCYVSNYGNRPAALGWVARGERLLEGARPAALYGWVCALRGYLADDLASALTWTDSALACARQTGDVDLELTTLADRGLALVRAGRAGDGLALLDEAMAGTLAGECRRLETVVFAGCDMLEACELACDLDRARRWCEVADGFIRTYGCPFLYASCRMHYGALLTATGRWTQADAELRAAVRMTSDVGSAPRATALSRLADLRLRQGRLEEAEALVEQCGDDPSALLPAARVRLARGEAAAAAGLAEQLVHRRHGTRVLQAQALALLVEARLADGCVEAAVESARRIDALGTGGIDDPVTAYACWAGARLHAAAGEVEPAVEQLSRALDAFARMRLPLEAASVRLDTALLLAEPDPARAKDEARAALAAFTSLGASGNADAAAALLRSLGVGGRTGPRDVGTLTRREREVLGLVGLGLSNAEIAQRLFISPRTAAHHVSSVLGKLGARNRAEAVAYAARLEDATS